MASSFFLLVFILKKSVYLVFLLIGLLVLCSVNVGYASFTVDSSSETFGFQNDSYLGFEDTHVFVTEVDGGSTGQEGSSNSSYPDFWFFQEQGSNSVYGFHVDGATVVVTNFFVGGVLEFTADSDCTVKVYVGVLGTPTYIYGAEGVHDSVLDVATLTVTDAGTVQVLFNVVVDTGGSSGGGGVVVPSESPFFSDSDFVVDDLDLGVVSANSSLSAKLSFTFSGSSYTVQSVSFSEPFQTWFVEQSFASYQYILSGFTQSRGTLDLQFVIPANLAVEDYNGTVTINVLDAFGNMHTSSANVYALAEGAYRSFNLIEWLRNPLSIAGVVILVLISLALIVFFDRRR